MAGSQLGVQYNNEEDINHLLLAVNTRLNDYFNDYNLSDNSVSYVQLTFRKLDKVPLSELSLNKPEYLADTEVNQVKRKLNIP